MRGRGAEFSAERPNERRGVGESDALRDVHDGRVPRRVRQQSLRSVQSHPANMGRGRSATAREGNLQSAPRHPALVGDLPDREVRILVDPLYDGDRLTEDACAVVARIDLRG